MQFLWHIKTIWRSFNAEKNILVEPQIIILAHKNKEMKISV